MFYHSSFTFSPFPLYFDASKISGFQIDCLWLDDVQEGKNELFEYSHPDPYCVPYMPGGSLFMRNPPPPLSICFPDGDYPEDAPKYTLNPDMSICKPETGKSAVGSVLVDFGKKNME